MRISLTLWTPCGRFQCAPSGFGNVTADNPDEEGRGIHEPVCRVEPAVIWIWLGCVPQAESFVECVAEKNFEDVKGFVDGTREVDVPSVEVDGVVEVSFDVQVGRQSFRAESFKQGLLDGWLVCCSHRSKL